MLVIADRAWRDSDRARQAQVLMERMRASIVEGRGNVALTFRGTTIIYRGRADIVAASGAYRTLRARGLAVTGSGPISGETFAVRITGRASG